MATAEGEIIGSGAPHRVSTDSTGGGAAAPKPSGGGAARQLPKGNAAKARHKGVGAVKPLRPLVPVRPSAQVRAALAPDELVLDHAPDNSLGERMKRLHEENQRVKLRLERVEKNTTR